MRYLITILFFYSFILECESQNLVQNNSFEEFDSCYQYLASVSTHPVRNNIAYWYTVSYGSPDLASSCYSGINANQPSPNNLFGYQYPHEGSSFIGFMAYCLDYYSDFQVNRNREYICSTLSSAFIIGHTYRISYFWSLANISRLASNKLGVYFSTDSISLNIDSNNLFFYTPQIIENEVFTDTQNWNEYSIDYTATEESKHFCIGSFTPNESTDTIRLSNYILNDTNSIVSSYYFIDDVSIIDLDSIVGINENEFYHFQIYPNPAQNTISIKNKTPVSVSIYSISSSLFLTRTIKKEEDIDISQLPNGIYVVAVGNRRERLVVCR